MRLKHLSKAAYMAWARQINFPIPESLSSKEYSYKTAHKDHTFPIESEVNKQATKLIPVGPWT